MLEVKFILLQILESHPGSRTMIWEVAYKVQTNCTFWKWECSFKTTLRMNSLMGLLKQFLEPASFRQGRQQSCNQGTSQRMSLDNCSHSHLGMSFSSLFHYTLYPLLNTSTFALEVGNAQQPVYRRPCTVNLLYSIWSLSSCSGTIG